MDFGQALASLPAPAKVLVILVLINVAAFLMFGLDKWFAIKGMRRISERNLFLVSLIGGSPAALLAMQVFRHKRAKRSFTLTMVFIVALQGAGLVWLALETFPILNQSA